METCLCSGLSCQNCPHAAVTASRLPPGHLHRQVWDSYSGQITNSNNVRMSCVFISHTLTDTEWILSGNNVETCWTQIMIIYRFPSAKFPLPPLHDHVLTVFRYVLSQLWMCFPRPRSHCCLVSGLNYSPPQFPAPGIRRAHHRPIISCSVAH